jgi:hypothetical protein
MAASEYRAVAPIDHLWNFSGSERSEIDLGNGIVVALPGSQWLPKEIEDQLENQEIDDVVYRSAAFVANIDPSIPLREFRESGLVEHEAAAILGIDNANLAMWLAKPSNARTKRIYFLERGNSSWRLVASSRRDPIFPHSAYSNDLCFEADLDRARSLHLSIASLADDSPVAIALSAFGASLRQQGWPLRYSLAWITLEALFGVNSPGELSFRLCQRLALFLETEPNAREARFKEFKKLYKFRSLVVHGLKMSKISYEEQNDSMLKMERAVQSVTLQILEDKALLETFQSNERDQYLDRLAFQ